jgi:hypothetical protein
MMREMRELELFCQIRATENAFWERMLPWLTGTLAADGSAVWAVSSEKCESLALCGDIDELQPADPQRASWHQGQVRMMAASGGKLLPLRTKHGSNAVLISGVVEGNGFEGTRVIEFVLDREVAPLVQRGYVRYVTQLCEFIGQNRIRCQPEPPAFPALPPKPPKPPKPSANLDYWLIAACKCVWQWAMG